MADARWLSLFTSTPVGTAGSASSASLDATNYGNACVFSSFTGDAITHLFFRYTLRTGTPPSYIIALEGVDTSGNPDGTVLGGGSPASAVFTPPADATWNATGQWVALDNSYTPSIGQMLALTIRYSSGTVDASNYSQFTRTIPGVGAIGNVHVPYNLALVGGSWSKTSIPPIYGYKTASHRYGVPVATTYTTTTATSGHRHCQKITIPSDYGTGISVFGIAVATQRHGAGSGSYKLGIWDAAGTELAATGSLDSDISSGPTNGGTLILPFSSPYSLVPGSTYYLGIENTSAQTMGITGWVFADADDREIIPHGTAKCLSVWNGSAWTDNTLVVPMVDLITSTITFPAGSSLTGLKRGIRL